MIFQALGKTGKVIKIYPDGDMRVQLGGHIWTFNPMSVTLVPAGSEAANSFTEASRGKEAEALTCLRLSRRQSVMPTKWNEKPY
jgi:hypothetical protein